VPVHPLRPAIAVPVAGSGGQPMPVAPAVISAVHPGVPPQAVAPPAATSPWVRRASGDATQGAAMPVADSHDGGLLARGVHAEAEG
jgi:hypothetical protein